MPRRFRTRSCCRGSRSRSAAIVPRPRRGLRRCRRSAASVSTSAVAHHRFCGEWYRAGIAAALADDARAVSLLPPNFGTTGTAHRNVVGEMLQHYAPFLELIKPQE